jgi:phage/plasmid-associated DNA primase
LAIHRETLLATNTIAAWAEENLVYEKGELTYIGNLKKSTPDQRLRGAGVYLDSYKYLYPNYVTYCEESGKRSVSKTKFSSQLEELVIHSWDITTL